MPTIPAEVRQLIQTRLSELAALHRIKIFYAVESGSRAWGFPSPDSDYDVRFIYAHPRDWYLSLEEQRDVLDLPLEHHALGLLDLGGWDLRKTLRLARKSNPVIWEWLQSPMVYQGLEPERVQALRGVLDPFYSPIAACHHYLSLARGTMGRELQGATVKIKKYFYMIRPLLAAMWIERHLEIPPMEFMPLLALLDKEPSIRAAIDGLLTLKRHTDESVPILRVAEIDLFLAMELKRLQEASKTLPAAAGDLGMLDGLFLEWLEVLG